MTFETNLQLGLIVWLVTIGAAAFIQWRWRLPRVGLTLAYLVSLSIVHWAGAFVHVLPWFNFRDVPVVATGFQQGVYGVVAFGIGAVVLAPMLAHLMDSVRTQAAPPLMSATTVLPWLPKAYILAGLFNYFFLTGLLGHIPTVSAIVSAANQLLIVGLGLACWHAWKQRNQTALAGWYMLALGLPLLTIIFQGFLGYGLVALVAISLFIASFVQLRWRGMLLTAFAIYIGLSFYVTYMRDRSEIRDLVWGGAELSSRTAQILDTITTIEWFDLNDQAHLRRIDVRLNQNVLVGAAVYNLATGYRTYAEGETFWQAFISLVPRALWPDKPVQAGSQDLVTTYTGIEFERGTSVGIGQVMEFYVNFGAAGVICGFVFWGLLVGSLDRIAALALQRDDWLQFAFWYLPGLALLQAGGSLVDVTATVAVGFIVALVAPRLLVMFFGLAAKPIAAPSLGAADQPKPALIARPGSANSPWNSRKQ